MKFDHRYYIPCLRWKEGECQAVSRLRNTTKQKFTPLIEVPEIGWDFGKRKDIRTIDEHLKLFVKRIHKKWGNSPCFVDLTLISPDRRMVNGIHPVRFIFDELRTINSQAIPVTGLDRDGAYQKEVKSALSKNNLGLCLRILIEQAARSSFKEEIDFLLPSLEISFNNCDFILDLDTPNFLPLEGFSMAIKAVVSKLPYLGDWRTFTLLGASFPKSMGGIKIGITSIPRYEWQLYKILVSNFQKARLRLPTFGDYAISHPEFSEFDMRLAKPPVKIRYTIDDRWYIVKGKNYKDYGYGQYHELSKQILNSDYYYGPSFSWGDQYIQECANGGKTGNLTMWVKVDTNHHIEKVTQDIASFYDSLNTF